MFRRDAGAIDTPFRIEIINRQSQERNHSKRAGSMEFDQRQSLRRQFECQLILADANFFRWRKFCGTPKSLNLKLRWVSRLPHVGVSPQQGPMRRVEALDHGAMDSSATNLDRHSLALAFFVRQK